MNPQIRFGEDLMSRVSYVMMNPGGDVEMTDAVVESINELLVAVCSEAAANAEGHEEAGINDILDLTFVANPVMHHLFCLLYTSPSPRDATLSRMPSSA